MIARPEAIPLPVSPTSVPTETSPEILSSVATNVADSRVGSSGLGDGGAAGFGVFDGTGAGGVVVEGSSRGDSGAKIRGVNFSSEGGAFAAGATSTDGRAGSGGGASRGCTDSVFGRTTIDCSSPFAEVMNTSTRMISTAAAAATPIAARRRDSSPGAALWMGILRDPTLGHER